MKRVRVIFLTAVFLLMTACDFPFLPTESSVFSDPTVFSDLPDDGSSPPSGDPFLPTDTPAATLLPTDTPSPTPTPTVPPALTPSPTAEPTPSLPLYSWEDVPVGGLATRPVTPGSPLSAGDYYWRSTLTAGEKTVYDAVAAASRQYQTTVSLPQSYPASRVGEILTCFFLDHPENFWWGTSYTLYGTESAVRSVQLTLAYPVTQIETMQKQLDSVVSRVLSGLPADSSDWEAQLYFHDWLCEQVTYGTGRNGDHAAYTLYGALCDRVAVCEGYAEAFQYLCQAVGIPCMGLTGTAVSDGVPAKHKWNGVSVGGAWYFTDVTWDDSIAETGCSHRYFALTSADMALDHTPDLASLIPSSPAVDASFYAYYGFTVTPTYIDNAFLRSLHRAITLVPDGETAAVELIAPTEADAQTCFIYLTANGNAALQALLQRYAEETGLMPTYQAAYQPSGRVLRFNVIKSPVLSFPDQFPSNADGQTERTDEP